MIHQEKDAPQPWDFVAPFRYLFDNPDAGMNFLLASVTLLIPIVGPIVLMGWYGRILRALARRESPSVPRYDFNQFVEYLKEGLLPFVISWVVMIPVVLLFMVLIMVSAMAIPLFAQQPEASHPYLIATAVFAGILIFVVVIIAISIVTNAALTRAYLTGDWSKTFNFGKIFSYAKSTWKSVFIVMLVYFPASILMLFIGMLFLYVGIYPASILMGVAWVHFMGQIYQRYLATGAEPIPVKAA